MLALLLVPLSWAECSDESSSVMPMERWSRCTIDRFENLPPRQFEMPFLLTNVTAEADSNAALTSEAGLIDAMGDERISWSVAALSGTPRGKGAFGKFGDYMRLHNSRPPCAAREEYLFSEMPRAVPFHPPAPLDAALNGSDCEFVRHIGVGSHLSGLSEHQHGEAWAYSLVGRKKWFFAAAARHRWRRPTVSRTRRLRGAGRRLRAPNRCGPRRSRHVPPQTARRTANPPTSPRVRPWCSPHRPARR